MNMKKVIFLVAIVAALASCQSKSNKTAVDDSAIDSMMPIVEETEVYAGTLPATAGSPAINYVLTLDMMADSNDTLYTLDVVCLDDNQQPTAQKMSVKDKPEMIKKIIKDKKLDKKVNKAAIKLTPNDGSEPMYFLVTNDTTLTLTTDSLQESISDIGFNIVRVK